MAPKKNPYLSFVHAHRNKLIADGKPASSVPSVQQLISDLGQTWSVSLMIVNVDIKPRSNLTFAENDSRRTCTLQGRSRKV